MIFNDLHWVRNLPLRLIAYESEEAAMFRVIGLVFLTAAATGAALGYGIWKKRDPFVDRARKAAAF